MLLNTRMTHGLIGVAAIRPGAWTLGIELFDYFQSVSDGLSFVVGVLRFGVFYLKRHRAQAR